MLSAVELNIMKMRLIQGQENKAKRGEMFRMIAPGYKLNPEGKLVKDPNRRVRESIELVFRKYREFWSIRQTFLWFSNENVELPVNKVVNGRMEIVFQPATNHAVQNVLKNPIYAGAYVYGARPQEVVLVDGTQRSAREGTLGPTMHACASWSITKVISVGRSTIETRSA